MGGAIFVKRIDDTPLWAVSSSYYSPGLIDACRAVPGLQYNPKTHDRFGYPDAVRAVVARLGSKGISVRGASELPEPYGWRTARTPFLYAVENLRPYQVEGVRFIISKSPEGALLADGPRLGKSCQTITAARAFKQHTLIVCPPHLVGVWARPPDAPEGPGEIAKWWPDVWRQNAVAVCEGTTAKTMLPLDLATAQVVVCHYDILYAWVERLLAWGVGMLGLDEIHMCMGYRSRRTTAVKQIAAHAKRRVGLSGTPMQSRPRDLHPVLDILCPGRFGYFFAESQDPEVAAASGKTPMATFSSLYCNAHKVTVGGGVEAKEVWDYKGSSNLSKPDGKTCLVEEETLAARLRYMMLRRVKSEIDDQLPEMQRQIIDVPVAATKQIGITGTMLDQKGKGLRHAPDLAADGKFKHVVTTVRQHLLDRSKVLAFCYRRQFAEILAADLGDKASSEEHIVWVHGELSAKERDKRIYSLKMHDGPGVIVATIDSASTGLDLSFCDLAVFCELTWEPADLLQAEDRLYKVGSAKRAFIQYIIARGTGDELVLRGIIDKLGDFAETFGTIGSNIHEDLSKKKQGALAALSAEIGRMQLAAPVKKRKRKGEKR